MRWDARSERDRDIIILHFSRKRRFAHAACLNRGELLLVVSFEMGEFLKLNNNSASWGRIYEISSMRGEKIQAIMQVTTIWVEESDQQPKKRSDSNTCGRNNCEVRKTTNHATCWSALELFRRMSRSDGKGPALEKRKWSQTRCKARSPSFLQFVKILENSLGSLARQAFGVETWGFNSIEGRSWGGEKSC